MSRVMKSCAVLAALAEGAGDGPATCHCMYANSGNHCWGSSPYCDGDKANCEGSCGGTWCNTVSDAPETSPDYAKCLDPADAVSSGTEPNDLCQTCKDAVNELANYGTKGACTAACELIPGAEALCPMLCGLIPGICGPKSAAQCGDAVCSAISVCQHNPWMYESTWNFDKPSDTPNLGHEDIISVTSSGPSDDVPAGTVKVGIKCTASSWWKSVTMFQGTQFLREVAATQDHQGQVSWGSINYGDLTNHYFSLSKAKAFGVHTNVYHITNAVEMKERGTYLFDWSKDGVEEVNNTVVV